MKKILNILISSITLIKFEFYKNIKQGYNMNFYLFIVTVPNIEEGKRIAQNLVETKLAACVNIIKNVSSVYRWKGEIQEDDEPILIIKTTEQNCESIVQRINTIHSYDIPECIGLKIEKGSQKYLNWIKEVVD
jgi:periplasmic divalent cation tolerance protein